MMKNLPLYLFLFLLSPIFIFSQSYERDTLDYDLKPPRTDIQEKRELFPNIAGKSLMTPTGWGGNRNFIFGALGGTYPQTYTENKTDLAASAGIGVGSSITAVSCLAIANMNDVSGFGNFSGSLIISRRIAKGTSISVGALHLLADPKRSDIGPSYYIVYSHADQDMPSKTTGNSRLNYSIGIGSGRFVEKSLKDEQAGRGKYGTAVFWNITYEIINSLNLTAEWSGLNLGFAVGWRPFPKLPALNLGLFDITRYTGDRARFVFTIAHAFYLN